MRTFPVGNQTFTDIIERDHIYVDKTESIYQIISAMKSVFIARPRRFGKSLTVSTIEAIFRGQKESFKGCYIYDKLNWEKYNYPVLRLDLAGLDLVTNDLASELTNMMRTIALQYNIQLDTDTVGSMFRELLLKMSNFGKIVLLVDEYDMPINNFLDKPEKLAQHIDILRSLYGNIKPLDEHIQFFFMTGVTRYGKLSLFSTLNHLQDLTMDSRFSTMFGFTQTELHQYFQPQIDALAEKRKQPMADLLHDLRTNYNGYSWDGETTVYNPFGIGQVMAALRFQSYWVQSGAFSILGKLIRTGKLTVQQLQRTRALGDIIGNLDAGLATPIPYLFQAGYLTIKEVLDEERQDYILHVPNEEVRRALYEQAFYNYLSESYIPEQSNIMVTNLADHLQNKDFKAFFKLFSTLIASIPYNITQEREAYWHTVTHIILYCTGLKTQSELLTNQGRIDTVVETKTQVFIFEFKIRGSADAALQQIQTMHYAQQFEGKNKEITYLGVVFDTARRKVKAWQVGQ